MNEAAGQRRLAAILVADVVGSSRLIEIDEAYALAAINAVLHDVLIASAARRGGRLVKTMGDGALIEFGSPVEAVACADEVQRALATRAEAEPADRRLLLRIGINLGDVVVRPDGDLYGDGVNVAARLEPLAPPGGIAVSAKVRDELHGRLSLAWQDGGEQTLKSITRPIRVFVVLGGEGTPTSSTEPTLPDKPSIAVLPFTNMSGDPEQDYFADGIVEDITTALSRFHRLFVIARNSSFTYKGKAVDIRQVGRELGVRYVLEGSIRKAGNRVRITGQLIETSTSNHLWADRFDGSLEDIFDLQDEITEKVVSALEPKIQAAEIERSRRRRPSDLGAYDLYLRGLAPYHSMTRDGLDDAERLFREALALDPRDAASAGLLGGILAYKTAQGWAVDLRAALEQSAHYCRLAQTLNPDDAETLALSGRILAYATADYETAIEMVDRAVQINPNSAQAWSERGWAYMYAQLPEAALTSLNRALRLSPKDPMGYSTLTAAAFSHLQLGQLEAAIEAARRSLRANVSFTSTHRALAAALAQAGRIEEAQDVARQMLTLEPQFRVSEWLRRAPGTAKTTLLVDGMRAAGLPE